MAHASLCRALAARSKTAALGTIARDPSGYPFATLVAIAFDDAGRPLLLLSQLAEHTANLGACDRASVMVHEERAPGEVLAQERMTIVGTVARVPDAEVAKVRATYLAAQPSSEQFASFKDFAFYRLEPVAVRYVGGFGKMSWVDLDEYRANQS
jgi:putative heme iron utilization protein